MAVKLIYSKSVTVAKPSAPLREGRNAAALDPSKGWSQS